MFLIVHVCDIILLKYWLCKCKFGYDVDKKENYWILEENEVRLLFLIVIVENKLSAGFSMLFEERAAPTDDLHLEEMRRIERTEIPSQSRRNDQRGGRITRRWSILSRSL